MVTHVMDKRKDGRRKSSKQTVFVYLNQVRYVVVTGLSPCRPSIGHRLGLLSKRDFVY